VAIASITVVSPRPCADLDNALSSKERLTRVPPELKILCEENAAVPDCACRLNRVVHAFDRLIAREHNLATKNAQAIQKLVH
jgi:L-asparaginase II